MKKRLMLCAIVLLSSLAIFAQTETTKTGYCGSTANGGKAENIKWTWTKADSTLRFEGKGDMDDYYWDGDRPAWFELSKDPKQTQHIYISEGITSIGEYALPDLEIEVHLPSSIERIYNCAFQNSKFTNLTVGKNSKLNFVHDKAFDGTYLAINKIQQDDTIYLENVLYCYKDKLGIKTFKVKDGTTTLLNGSIINSYVDTIIVPASLTNIYGIATKYVSAKIVMEGTTPPVTTGNAFPSLYTTDLYIPYAAYSAYNKAPWTNVKDIKPIAGGTSGNCGKGTDAAATDAVTWRYDASSKTLTISGSGAMKDFSTENEIARPEWYQYRNQIEHIEIADGVTSIGAYAFDGFTKTASLHLSSNITAIGANGLKMTGLTTLRVDAQTPPTLGADALPTDKSGITLQVHPLKRQTYKGDTNWQGQNFKAIKAVTDVQGFCGVTENTVPWYLTKEGILLIEGTGIMKNYATAAETPWASYKAEIKEVQITDGVTAIGDNAFNGITNLSKITLPANPDSVGIHAFDGTAWYAGKTDDIYIGDIYYRCKTTTADARVEIKGGTTQIAKGAFEDCKNLSRVDMPVSIAAIGTDAFKNAQADSIVANNPTAIDIDKSVFAAFAKDKSTLYVPYKSQESYNAKEAWQGFKETTYIKWGYCGNGAGGKNISWKYDAATHTLDITGKGEMAGSIFGWQDFGKDVLKIRMSDGITNIGSYMGNTVPNITDIKLSKDIEIIGEYAFFPCSKLEKLEFNENLQTIKLGAFANCAGLKTFTIPANVTTIESQAFTGCSNIKILFVKSESVPFIVESTFLNCNPTIVFVPKNSIDAYKANSKWNQLNIQAEGAPIANGTCGSTKDGADGSNIEWVLDYKGVLTLSGSGEMETWEEEYTIKKTPWQDYLSLIDTLVVEEGITNITTNAFDGADKLVDVKTPTTLGYVGGEAFRGTPWLEAQKAEGKDIYIGKTFYLGADNADNKHITIKEGTVHIAKRALKGNVNINALTIPSTVTIIGSEAIYDCESLSKIDIAAVEPPVSEKEAIGLPDNVIEFTCPEGSKDKYIKDRLWRGVVLNGYYEKDNGKNIFWKIIYGPDDKMFLYMDGKGAMAEVDYAKGEHTPWYAYRDSITGATINGSITTIAPYTFADHSKLDNILISPAVDSIGDRVFSGCRSLKTIYMTEDSLQSIGYKAIDDTKWYAARPAGDLYIGKIYYKHKGAMPAKSTKYINPGTEQISGGAFEEAGASLEKVGIPASIKSVGQHAFKGCTGIRTFISEATVVPAAFDSTFTGITYPIRFVYPEGTREAYRKDPCWNLLFPHGICGKDGGDNLEWEIFDDIKLVIDGKGAMDSWKLDSTDWAAYNKKIRTIELSDTITTIGRNAFAGMIMLDSITLPDTLERIEADAFRGNISLRKINIPAHLDYVGGGALEKTPWLERRRDGDIILGNTYYKHKGQFYNDTVMSLADGIKYLAAEAFIDSRRKTNDSITGLVLPATLKEIEDRALAGCDKIARITVLGTEPAAISANSFTSAVKETAEVIVPRAAYEAYKADTEWSAFKKLYKDQYQVTVKGDAKQGEVKGAGLYKIGEEVTIEAIAKLGYKFIGWSDGEQEAQRTFNIYDDYELEAKYEIDYVTLTVNSTPICKTTGSCTVQRGKEATLTAEVEFGFVFAGWSDGNTDNPRKLIVMSDTVIDPIVRVDLIDITVESEDESKGYVEGGGQIARGDSTEIKAIAGFGYEFDKWSDGNTQNPRIVTAEKDITYTAIFKLQGTAVEEVEGETALVVVNNGMLIIETESDYAIYTATGMTVKSGHGNAVIIDLPRGVYMIKVGKTTYKTAL